MPRVLLRYTLARLLTAFLTVLGVAVLAFILTHVVSGDPIQSMVGQVAAPPEYVKAVREQFGLDDSLGRQLWLYLVNLAHGDLGFSYASREDVMDLLLVRAGRTMILMIPGLVIASIAGVAMALLSAAKAGTSTDAGVTVAALFGYSVPIYWLGQVLIMIFAVKLGWLPAQGMHSPLGGGFGDLARHWVLPGAAVSIYFLAVVARVGRSALIESLQQDYILTARSIGVGGRRMMLRHVLPNGLVPIITVIGYNFGFALTGAILTETVFGWPGLGQLFNGAIQQNDFPVIVGIFIFSATLVVLVNLITDLAYFWVDPRIRTGYEQHG